MAVVTMKNWLVDPFNSDALDSVLVKSAYYSGTFDNMTAPIANYPESSPTRLFLYTDWIIDVSDLAGTKPCSIRDVTTSTTLTRVTGTPSTNEYRLPPSTSEGKNIIELHTGQVGHTIGYSFYTNGSVIYADKYNNMKNTGSLSSDGIITATNGFMAEYMNSSGVASTKALKWKIIELGDWNMDSTVNFNRDISISGYLLFAWVIIRTDGGGYTISPLYYNYGGGSSVAGGIASGSGSINMTRATGGLFDSTSYDSTSYNRGWILAAYVDTLTT